MISGRRIGVQVLQLHVQQDLGLQLHIGQSSVASVYISICLFLDTFCSLVA